MRVFFFFLSLIYFLPAIGQEKGKWMRAFPITAYMVDLDDSTKVVQLEMPEGMHIPEKQLAVAVGSYKTSKDDAVNKGYGRCQLIKSRYHYFAIGHNESGVPLAEGDLLYMFIDSTEIYYGLVPKLAGHFIRLQDVYEQPFYDRYFVFNDWTAAKEEALLDTLVGDIRFTGKYFIENHNDQNQLIESPRYGGKRVFDVMVACTKNEVAEFLAYMLDNPRLYAGNTWKIAEIFATWATRAR